MLILEACFTIGKKVSAEGPLETNFKLSRR